MCLFLIYQCVSNNFKMSTNCRQHIVKTTLHLLISICPYFQHCRRCWLFHLCMQFKFSLSYLKGNTQFPSYAWKKIQTSLEHNQNQACEVNEWRHDLNVDVQKHAACTATSLGSEYQPRRYHTNILNELSIQYEKFIINYG